MTGWRLGWIVLPPDLVRPVDKLASNFYISAPTVSQVAAITALDCDEELQENLHRYARNREILLDGLPKAGFKELAPSDGAFYVYADVRHITPHAGEFCKDMLESTGVAATPGMDFDPEDGHHFVRFSYCGSTEATQEAVKRLQQWMSAN
uniref:Aminotransferase class I/classII large domain-containing protein n=1 Tax=Tetraselmis chuii TaxID=63592 RepID=A0A7S1X234_9CHLO|mmetsp:Transcript_24163/g.43021  ORF Transcript_24163/g.43021 Transcript_24163/m.43021 type:complete len:150 (+) Transcript_24163:47-496(+)